MVDVTHKPVVYREAIAEGAIRLRPETIRAIREGRIEKGDVLTTAAIAGILAAKKTWDLIPLCHPLPLTHVDVKCEVSGEDRVVCRAKVVTSAKTGVEMEALTAVSIALLTVWDMTKKLEKDEEGQYPYTRIEYIRVVSKKKGGEA
ncbi:cyclic pyranopterin monophosphate synthase MoaC [Pyrolobus fumarii]|nr:cyclic pyranopterin monophosphate synthase MoaC [Pyrolobus fumarii]